MVSNNKIQFLDDETKNILTEFFSLTKILIDKKIVRSSKYIADISEYLCKEIYKLTLCESQREPGYDGIDKNKNKYQIKINNSKEKTNQEVGNPEAYDFLLLMITSNSNLFNSSIKDTFISIYKISNKKLLGCKNIAKTKICELEPEYIIDNNFEIKKYEKNVC